MRSAAAVALLSRAPFTYVAVAFGGARERAANFS